MSTKGEEHIETESEDGGVALSMGSSSDEMEVDRESAPTSTSQSPILTATSALHVTEIPPQDPNDNSSLSYPSAEQDVVSAVSGETSAPLYTFESLQETSTQTPPAGLMSSSEASISVALIEESYSLATPSSAQNQNMIDALGESLDPVLTSSNSTSLETKPSVAQVEVETPSPTLSDIFGPDFLSQNADPPQSDPSDADGFIILQDGSFYDGNLDDFVRNLQCDGFFRFWKSRYSRGEPGYPRISGLASHLEEKVQRQDKLLAEDLHPEKPDRPDFQGIHWSRLLTTKEKAREVRRMTYTNHINETEFATDNTPRLISNSGSFGSRSYKAKFSERALPSSDRHFDFRETNMRFRSYISHFQLRHNLFASSKNALLYTPRPKRGLGYGAYIDFGPRIEPKIHCFNPETSDDECVMDFSREVDLDSTRLFRPSTLNAGNGVLVVGSFEGAYAMKSLSTTFESKPTMGTITDCGPEGSTNHIQNFLDRQSGLPQVAFSSNDRTIRTLDCTTNKFTRIHTLPYPVNCSAICPDGRLRLLVGDDCLPIIANAETGEEIARLPGHTNFGFACDWAADGVIMATGHQDGFVKVWDARNFSQSVHSIPMEMAGCRTLQFSPPGSGKRVLVIAEPGDFVHVVDARTFKSKQVIDFFGEIAGISMPPDGSSLYIANHDPRYGGLMEFERSWGSKPQDYEQILHSPAEEIDDDHRMAWEAVLDQIENKSKRRHTVEQILARDTRDWLGLIRKTPPSFDWLADSDLDDDPRVKLSGAHRNRRGLGLRNLIV